jgi:hypothetical protein
VPATAANPNGKEYSTQVQFSTADTPAAFGQPGSTLAPAPIAENSGYNGSAPSSSAGACSIANMQFSTTAFTEAYHCMPVPLLP